VNRPWFTCIVDASSRLIYANDGLVRLLGFPREEIVGQSPLMFFVPNVHAHALIETWLEEALRGESHDHSALISKRCGQRLWVHVSFTPVFDIQGQVEHVVIVMTDITQSKLYEILQETVTGALLRGDSVESALTQMCQEIEHIAPEVIVSVLAVDEKGIVHPLASPGLPADYSQALEGLSIGPVAGSCGTAAYRGEPVLVTDINTDPLWADYKALVKQSGLRACWSIPVRNSSGRVAATFALYFRESRGADPLHAHLVSAGTYLCMLALDREEKRQAAQDQSGSGLLSRYQATILAVYVDNQPATDLSIH
jgi:PAS domain S-box-containing protein